MISTEELEKFHPEKYPRNDIGTSNLFATVWGSVLVYVTERKSYQVIRQLNEELAKKGYLTFAGRVSAAYFNERMYGMKVEGD